MYHNFIITKILDPDEAHSVHNVDTLCSESVRSVDPAIGRLSSCYTPECFRCSSCL